MNGQDHAHEAETLLSALDETSQAPQQITWCIDQAQVHATLAVAYAQAGAWKDIPSTPAPFPSLTCDDTWLYLDGRTPLGCVRVRRHDGDHVTGDGIVWNDRKGPNPETLVVHPLRPDDPRNKVTTHVREVSDQGPDYCKPCSEAIGEWVPWPCAGSLSSEPCAVVHGPWYGTCVRARGHDGNHVTVSGFDWVDS